MNVQTADASILVDGHVHSINRAYWERIDPWNVQAFGFDFAQAAASGVNVVIENVATYGYGNFNQTAKQTLRLVETLHRVIETHGEKMALALSASHAREIVSGGRLAVFLGVESGFDHEGDPDVLRAFHRLGVRVVQFATQTCFNAFADSEAGGPPAWNGLNKRGRELVALMNDLGILIDIAHATPQSSRQIIECSRAPMVASHASLAAVSGAGLSDETLRALADKGGMVGIIGASASISAAYRAWLGNHPEQAALFATPVANMVGFTASLSRSALDHGEFGAWLDAQMRVRHDAAFAPWSEPPGTMALVPTCDEWALHVGHVVATVGADHVGIGLDLVGGRSCVPRNAAGYPDLMSAVRRVTTLESARKIAGENWLRVLDRAQS